MIRLRSICPSLFFGLCLVAACGLEPDEPTKGKPREVPQIPLEVSAGQLEALFDEIIEKTERREAFSEVKEKTQSYSALSEMKDLRSEFLASKSEADLYYALVKLSNARRDRHLSVNPVDGGPERARGPRAGRADPGPAGLLEPGRAVVLRRQGGDEPLFAGTRGPHRRYQRPDHRGVRRGVHVQWIRHSTRYGLYWHMARELPLIVPGVPAEPLFGDPAPHA